MSNDDSIKLPDSEEKDESVRINPDVHNDSEESDGDIKPDTAVPSQPQADDSTGSEKTDESACENTAQATQQVSYSQDSYYCEDEEKYLPFDGKDAERIIEPTVASDDEEILKKENAN
ncbi:MAG: hypothetical protein ACI4SB_09635, partial [Acutalibacteraceae bacterium]